VNDSDAKSCLLYLHELYPKAAKEWAAARQQAFRDQIRPLPISVEQFRACANAVAMSNKPSWCPPENEILKKLRGVTDSVNTSRRADATRAISRQRGPDDRTFGELTTEYINNPALQENLTPAGLRMLSSLMGKRDASAGALPVTRGLA